MSKELEALEHIYYGSQGYGETDKYYEYLKNYFESINNAKPSEALKCWNYIKAIIPEWARKKDEKHPDILEPIKQALLKAQEQEKVLSIINEYQVDVWLLKQCDYKNYIRIRKEAMVSVGQIVNENGIILEDEITEEEFDLLKRYCDEQDNK